MEATKEKRLSTASSHLKEIAAYFLKMGVLGFGGPLALMAAFQRDLVDKRRWLAPEQFARALALIKALPGPTATQVSIYMGFVRGGRIGGLLAGICLIFPSFLMMVGLATFYASIEAFVWSKPLLFGMQAAALGVIAESAWRLSSPYRSTRSFWMVALAAALLTAWRPAIEPIVIVGSGLLGLAILPALEKPKRSAVAHALLPGFALSTGILGSPALGSLLGVCFKAGAFVFGTGLAIVPLLAHDVVETHHWLSQQQFMDALAFGQITPGPVLITATFIGYKVAGVLGAIVATFGVFGPAFFNILTWFPHAERRLGGSARTRQFVMWAIAAVIGSIVVAIGRLASTPPSGGTYVLGAMISALSLALSLLTHAPVWAIIPGGGLITAIAMLIIK